MEFRSLKCMINRIKLNKHRQSYIEDYHKYDWFQLFGETEISVTTIYTIFRIISCQYNKFVDIIKTLFNTYMNTFMISLQKMV